MKSIPWSEKIILCVELVFYIFQLSVLIVLLAKIQKNFNSAFYHILLIIFISDFICHLYISIFVIRLPTYGIWQEFYENNGWFTSFGHTSLAYLGFIQFFGQTLISFNRFTLLWFPLKHKDIWKNKKWYIILLLLVPFLGIAYRIPYGGYYSYKENGEVNGGYLNVIVEKISLFLSSFCLITCCSLSLILTILTVIKYAILKNSKTVWTQNTQLNLLVYSILLLFVQTLRVAYVILAKSFVTNPSFLHSLHFFLPLVIDAHAWFAAVALLALSSTARKIYYKFYGLDKIYGSNPSNKIHDIFKKTLIPSGKEIQNQLFSS